MHHIELPDLRNGYLGLVNTVIEHGEPFESRGLSTHELTGVTIVFPDPTGIMLPLGVGRGVNSRLAAVEALQLLSGTADVDLLRRASPNYTEVLVDPAAAAYGAYGPRLYDQLADVTSLLRREPDTRRAVLVIWQERDLTHDGDRPCTLSLQLLVRDGALQLIVNMRSQDVWLGVPYDMFMFTQLQRSIALELGLRVGRYTHHVGSFHLYDRDRAAADALTWCPDDRPVPELYPTGVVPTTDDRFYDAATQLVLGSFDVATARANPWYVRQLAAIGIGSSSQEVDA